MKDLFCLQFQRVHFMGTWLHVSGPVVMVGTCGHGDQKTEKERKRERERVREGESQFWDKIQHPTR
jgi:hypothetical protein